MQKPVIYVVANKGLAMSPGKLAAQVGHAVAGVLATGCQFNEWLRNHRWVIILEGDDEIHLTQIYNYLSDREVTTLFKVIDEGVNEVRPFSLTALGIGVLDKDSPEANYLSGLKKYRKEAPTIPYYGRGRCEHCGVPSGHYHMTTCEVPARIIVWK